MPRSLAKTVPEYLDSLPEDRRKALTKVRSVIRKHLPKGFEERMNWGVISYEVAPSRIPAPLSKIPMAYVALAAQKNYNAVYLMRVYADKKQEAQLRTGFKRAGKKLDIGKSCIRFKSPDDLALDVIGQLIADTTAEGWIEVFKRRGR